MHRAVTYGLLLSSCGVVAGCATTGLGDDSGTVSLPNGSTLLESEEDSCEGIIQLSAGIRGDDEVQVSPGQNATFRLEEDGEEVVWACLDERAPDAERMECPEDSEYVRVTRAAAGRDVLFECYG